MSNFKDMESLVPVVKVLNEASKALDDSSRTIAESSIPEILTGALGAGAGAAISFAALYSLGTVGLSAVGITTGLATAGLGAGMIAGIGVLAAPVVLLAAGAVGITAAVKRKKLFQEKQRLYQSALEKHNAIIKILHTKSEKQAERTEYLQSLNVLLQRAIQDLKADLGL